MSYLEKRGEDERWHISTKWLSPYSLAHLMGEIQFACLLLRGIWQVGRARYLDEAQELRIFRKPTLDEYKATLGEGIITNFMSINILYVYAYPQTSCARIAIGSSRARERARLSWRMYRDADGAPRVVCSDCAKHFEAA